MTGNNPYSDHHSLADNPATEHHLSHAGLSVRVISFGAAIQDIKLAGIEQSLVLGFPDSKRYETNRAYMGATAGRFANRLNQGQFQINGTHYQADRNENETHCLHGGLFGCGKRHWHLADKDERSALFTIDEPDGWMGFPGDISLSCHYEISDDGALCITYHGTTNQPTLLNLAHHSYFKLDDLPDISAHHLMIASDSYLPVTSDNIPTGDIADVTDTVFDFRQMKAIGTERFDHNFCLPSDGHLRKMVILKSAHSGIEMHLETDQPGLQFYTGDHLDEHGLTHHGSSYQKRAGLCLEPQNWPDAPNHAGFPHAIINADKPYQQRMRLQFLSPELMIA